MSTQIHIPAIEYRQGGRTMYTSVIEPGALIKLVEEPRVWNPVSKAGDPAGTNRPLSKPHMQGIVAYMERTLPKSDGEYVMDGVTLYGDEEELSFVPVDADDRSPIRMGRLGINLDAKFDI